MKRIIDWFYYFEKFIDRWWYSPVLGLCAALDHYVVVFPIFGMLISSIFLNHRKWLSLTLWCVLGSWLGALVLAILAQTMGIAFIESAFPAMLAHSTWGQVQGFFVTYGMWIVFIVGLLPTPQQPVIIISALAGTPLAQISVVFLIARLMKFLVVGYLASHAPRKLSRFKGLRRELKELHMSS